MNAKFLVAALGMAATFLVAKPSSAWVHVCNKTANPVWIVYADVAICDSIFDCGSNGCGQGPYAPFHATGWYSAAPGACVTTNGGDADDFYSYVYAENGLGSVWQDFTGPLIAAPQTAFSHCAAGQDGDLGCNAGTRCLWPTKWFPSTTNWTLNLN